VPPLFADLQVTLGYEFHRGDLLVEAATHPSFAPTGGSSYQRLEFLGDGERNSTLLSHSLMFR
jgi:endoribonuclease Dicer